MATVARRGELLGRAVGLERQRARSLHALRARIATKLLALAAGVRLCHYLGQPTPAFATLAASRDAE